MKIKYDSKADAMNIIFQKGKYDISKEVADGIIIDIGKKGKILSIEILDVSKRMPKESIEDVTVGLTI
ncbi:MAG TPA: DUF2283 domain-containing protein [Candidatus Aenigmarchaeota archaeon]|nr:DUF2283 domain-containing protein [Candidatus Aenigmarchaeota archaeon]